jgi:hypothetical protein
VTERSEPGDEAAALGARIAEIEAWYQERQKSRNWNAAAARTEAEWDARSRDDAVAPLLRRLEPEELRLRALELVDAGASRVQATSAVGVAKATVGDWIRNAAAEACCHVRQNPRHAPGHARDVHSWHS